ncbi:MAG: hydroxymethylbilane synthase [candidate division NC10 bacterium]|nr:hydroxymethylbilane synthase [candidate division NC10 bacterium]
MRGKRPIRIGTRGSRLALGQAEQVASEWKRAYPDWEVSLVRIRTQGDLFTEASFLQMGGRGLFVKEIEEALLAGRIDLAVHSMKDLPTELPPGLCIGAITFRQDPRDCLLSREGASLEELLPGARIGTSSLRRQAQLRHFRPDLRIQPLRGNLDTRIRKLTSEGLDAIILAAAGLHRLGMADRISEYLSPEICLPAAGQGCLGVEVREEDQELREAIRILHHEESAEEVLAERAFLRGLGGGCQIPIGVLARVEGEDLHLWGMVCDPEGKRRVGEDATGSAREAERLGEELAARIRPLAQEILQGGRLEEVKREGQGKGS